PLTDPTRFGDGFLLPIGGAKGYGLAMAIGLLAGTLNGAAFGKDVVEFSKDTVTATNTGQFIVAVSVAAFTDVETFKATVDAIFKDMRESAPLPGHDAVRIPGDQRGAVFEDRSVNGVPLHTNLIATLSEIAGELQIPELTRS
ncbi:MAG: Ldh family oxidoreductase, partial [bacterium]|nr:Ldh family oxidoreductase [bacterium]